MCVGSHSGLSWSSSPVDVLQFRNFISWLHRTEVDPLSKNRESSTSTAPTESSVESSSSAPDSASSCVWHIHVSWLYVLSVLFSCLIFYNIQRNGKWTEICALTINDSFRPLTFLASTNVMISNEVERLLPKRTRHAVGEIFLAASEHKILSLKKAELYIHSSGLFRSWGYNCFRIVFGAEKGRFRVI